METITWKTASINNRNLHYWSDDGGVSWYWIGSRKPNFGESTMPTPAQIETITKHYLIALLWTMPGDEDCENPGDSISLCDLPQETIHDATDDVISFVKACGELFDKAMACYDDGYGQHPDAGSAEAAFGHDFALTRNGHGTGFWDRDNEGLPKFLGYALTRICESFGEDNLYIDDDGRAYF